MTFFAPFRHLIAPVLHPKNGFSRWRVQGRRKGRGLSETFVRYEDAKVWAVEAEREIDRRPREDESAKLIAYFDENPQQGIPDSDGPADIADVSHA